MKNAFNKTAKTIALTALAVGSGFVGSLIYNHFNSSSAYNSLSERQQVYLTNYATVAPEANIDFTKAAELTVHAVVHVKTYYEHPVMGNPWQDPLQEFLFGGPRQQIQQIEATGSGVIISDDGYIATNNHVVEKAERVEITLNNRKTYTAKVIGTDPSTDLALLKIDEKNLPFVPYGNSDMLKVGEWVLAVGNPFNLNSTVTAGIVSAKARNINILAGMGAAANASAIESYIQTDAAVNRGNSGGALVNTKGELIGINSAIASNTGSYSGYSFAIPVNIVKKVLDDLLKYGQVQRALLGVTIADVDSKLADQKNLKEVRGVYVNSVTQNGAAQEAGITQGDVITKIGDVDVNTVPELQEQVSKFRPGDKLNVTVLRAGKEKVYALMLKNMNGSTDIVKKDKNTIISMLGANFETLNNDEMSRLGISNGVKISKLNAGKLRSAGIRDGFIITHIDKKPVKTTDDAVEMLNTKKGGVLIEGIYSNGMRAYYAFGM